MYSQNDIAAQRGTTELESRLIYHLEQADELFAALLEDHDRVIDTITVAQSFDALYRVIGQQVLAREYLGWAVEWHPLVAARAPEEEDDQGE